MPWVRWFFLGVLCVTVYHRSAVGDDFSLKLRTREQAKAPHTVPIEKDARWAAERTAVIVCDVWDYHHCLNAVRRLDEFLPRLNDLLTEARQRGATIIHAPSDCMDAYADHPARRRAQAAPAAANAPHDVQYWCSRIPREELAVYPIDQSDGGEDDDPDEHREWAAKLTALGRNPSMPWKRQSDKIAIDPARDYISDKGDEVWNILADKKIDLVMLTGVHVNMCVLGRPFGLRQLVRGGKQAVLVRDLTDAMYNPQRWPYVDHFTGTNLVIQHIERYVCPTITSDQVLGGEPFRFQGAPSQATAGASESSAAAAAGKPTRGAPGRSPGAIAPDERWSPIRIPSDWKQATHGEHTEHAGPTWYRCAVRMPAAWLAPEGAVLVVPATHDRVQAWCNGQPAERDSTPGARGAEFVRLRLPRNVWTLDDANLLVLRVEHPKGTSGLDDAAFLTSGKHKLSLRGQWQFRWGDSDDWKNIPLPAKFGFGSSYFFEAVAP